MVRPETYPFIDNMSSRKVDKSEMKLKQKLIFSMEVSFFCTTLNPHYCIYLSFNIMNASIGLLRGWGGAG